MNKQKLLDSINNSIKINDKIIDDIKDDTPLKVIKIILANQCLILIVLHELLKDTLNE